jgi:hypothetical protein
MPSSTGCPLPTFFVFQVVRYQRLHLIEPVGIDKKSNDAYRDIPIQRSSTRNSNLDGSDSRDLSETPTLFGRLQLTVRVEAVGAVNHRTRIVSECV